MTNTPCCGNCFFWRPVGTVSKITEQTDGRCHAVPPQALVVGMAAPMGGMKLEGIPQQAPQPVVASSFPPIKAFGWCGCHRYKEVVKVPLTPDQGYPEWLKEQPDAIKRGDINCIECAKRFPCPKHCLVHEWVYEDGLGDVCRFCGMEQPDDT